MQGASGPVDAAELREFPEPPELAIAKWLQGLRFNQRQIQFVFRARAQLGDVVRLRGTTDQPGPILVNHPDDVRSLFTARPEQVSSFAGGLLKQVVGPNSILTAAGARHLRQRKLLLPSFHGSAINEYAQVVRDVTERELDTWPLKRPFPLAPRLQAIALDVILMGIFGIRDAPEEGSAEKALRAAIIRRVGASSRPLGRLNGLISRSRDKPNRFTRFVVESVDRPLYEVIRKRRLLDDLSERQDILSLLLQARTEEGEAMSDKELRDELISLLLAGHETTTNSLAWTWERLLRNPNAYDTLREVTRAGQPDPWVEATIIEAMRCRPVVPLVGRHVNLPWRFGPFGVSKYTPVLISILLLHHREDLYPGPFCFRPERWLNQKPSAYGWVPFGGGIRRCLGATLAMQEQRIIVEKMAKRLDVEPDDPEPERAVHRNVTMIPAKGTQVVVRFRR